MRKILIAVLLASCVLTNATAQDTSKTHRHKERQTETEDEEAEDPQPPYKPTSQKGQAVAFGIEGGLNMSRLHFNNYYEGYNYTIKNRIAGRAGILLDISILRQLHLETGVFYAMNGVRGTFSKNGYANSETVNIHAIETPVTLMYKSNDYGYGRFFAGAGVFFGYNVSGTDKNTNEDIPSGQLDIGASDTDQIRTVDAGICLHAGYQLSNGLFFRARYQRGLKNISPVSDISKASIYSQSYGIDIGFYFLEKRKHKHLPANGDPYLNRKM